MLASQKVGWHLGCPHLQPSPATRSASTPHLVLKIVRGGEFPERVLEGDLPRGHSTDVDNRGRIPNGTPRSLAQGPILSEPRSSACVSRRSVILPPPGRWLGSRAEGHRSRGRRGCDRPMP